MLRLKFCEVEHSGDLEQIESDITRSGGIVVSSMPDYDEEEAAILIDTEDEIEFMKRFNLTVSADFID